MPSDTVVIPLNLRGGAGGGKAHIAIQTRVRITAKDPGDACVLPIDQVFRQLRSTGKIFLCDDRAWRKVFMGSVQKDGGELIRPQLFVQIQIRVWKRTFYRFHDQSAQRNRQQLLKDGALVGDAVSGQEKGDGKTFLYKRHLQVVSQSGISIVAVGGKQDGDLIMGSIRMKTGGVGSAALAPFDQSFCFQEL